MVKLMGKDGLKPRSLDDLYFIILGASSRAVSIIVLNFQKLI